MCSINHVVFRSESNVKRTFRLREKDELTLKDENLKLEFLFIDVFCIKPGNIRIIQM